MMMNKEFENKKSRVSWTLKLDNKFVDAVNQLGGSDVAVPRKILELMNVENLTRENVASHLQKYRNKLRKRSISSVAHPQLCSLSGSGQFHNTAVNSFPTTELIGTSNTPFVQNMHEFEFGQNNRNSELNFQSAIGHENCFKWNSPNIYPDSLAVDPKANAPTNSIFDSNLDSYSFDPLMWNLTEDLVTESSSNYQQSALIAQLRQESDPLIQLNRSTEPTLAFTPQKQQ